MKILYLTDLNYTGYSNNFQMGPRPPMSWISGLESYHCSYSNLNNIPHNDFDIAILGCIHENVDVLNIDIINKVRKSSKKLLFQHDSDHRYFYRNNSISRSYMLNFIILNVDGILIHNDLDKKYYENLYKKPCFYHKQLLLDVFNQLSLPKIKKDFLLGGIEERYGALDGYMLLQDYPSDEIYHFGNVETQIPNLNLIYNDFDYIKYNQFLTKFKITLNLTPLAIGGSFPLQCAMVKTPCIGWNNSNPHKECFPDLVADYGDFEKLRLILNKLINDDEFYNYVTEKARNIFLKEFSSLENYKKNMTEIFNQIKN
jgi:hypothetical protein